MSFYSYKNANAAVSPGCITGNPLEGLNERICIQVKNVYDACLQQEQLTNKTVTVSDIVPVLALTCTQAVGESRITDCGRLRLKESDRFAATVELLTALGADIHGEGDTLVLHGPAPLHGGVTLDARNDHRLVMLLALAGSIADAPVTITGAEALRKSWPTFLDTILALGGHIA